MGGGGEPECDVTASPNAEACLVSDEFAVFVSPLGDDNGEGSRNSPLRTLGRALELGHAENKLVLACVTAGIFSEALSVDASLDGVRLYGGFECESWESSSSAQTRVVAPSAVALRVQNLVEGLVIEGMSFEASDGATASESSMGAFVADSENVRFTRVSLIAGRGAPGDHGMGTTTAAATGAQGSAGTAACTVTSGPNPGGVAVESFCDGTGSGSVGGKGGDGGNGDDSAGNANGGMPPLSAGVGGTGEGSAAGWDCSVGPGKGGATAGAAGTPGTSGEGGSGAGRLSGTGYVPAFGATGTNGTPGQGGGGGGGAKAPTTCALNPRTGSSGGSGGGGGCAGKGGAGGTGGGASIALASVDSDVTLESVELTAKDGGEGGDGGTAQPGGDGGLPGIGASGGLGNSSCPGGQGGRGGNGGFGGGGAGGPSIGIAFVGNEPSQTAVDFQLAETPAPGGADGAAATIGDGAGAYGIVMETREFEAS
jgi:hypothetical protein